MRKLVNGIRLHYTAEPVRPLSREETLNAQNLSRKVTSTDKKLIVFQPISYGEKMNNIGKSAKDFFYPVCTMKNQFCLILSELLK